MFAYITIFHNIINLVKSQYKPTYLNIKHTKSFIFSSQKIILLKGFLREGDGGENFFEKSSLPRIIFFCNC